MSGVPTSFYSSLKRRFSAPALVAPRAAPSARPSVAATAATAGPAARADTHAKKEFNWFEGCLGLTLPSGRVAAAAQALLACVDAETGTLDLTRLPPESEFARLPYTMHYFAYGHLCEHFHLQTVRLPQAWIEDDTNRALACVVRVPTIRHVIVVMHADHRLPNFAGLKSASHSHPGLAITLRGPSKLPRSLAQRRASLPLLKRIGVKPEPATPTRPAARPSAPASIEPPTRHLFMPAPMTVSSAPGTQLAVPPKRLSLDVPSTR